MTFPSNPRRVEVFRDPDDVAESAASMVIHAAQMAIRVRGRFFIALAGGSTPERTYTRLARQKQSSQIAWSAVHIFFGDERMVPPDDPRSNFGMAQRALLASIPESHVYPIPTSGSPAGCAAIYALTLAAAFGISPGGPPPRFDLILLGLGDDGHTASLFPGAAALNEDRAWVTWSPPGTLPPPVDRVTLTYPVLNSAWEVIFLVSGANKAEALRDVWNGAPRTHRPAAGISKKGNLTFLVDEAAASAVRKQSPS